MKISIEAFFENDFLQILKLCELYTHSWNEITKIWHDFRKIIKQKNEKLSSFPPRDFEFYVELAGVELGLSS